MSMSAAKQRRFMPRTATYFCSWSTISTRSRRADLRRIAGSYFRGFYCWNSEVGAKDPRDRLVLSPRRLPEPQSLGRRGFQEITIRHSKFAASRFAQEAAPALTRFANSSPIPSSTASKRRARRSSRAATRTASEFLRKRGFSKGRRRRSSRACSPRKDIRRRACLISCRGLRRWRARSRTRTRGSIWRRGRRSCSTAPRELLSDLLSKALLEFAAFFRGRRP